MTKALWVKHFPSIHRLAIYSHCFDFSRLIFSFNVTRLARVKSRYAPVMQSKSSAKVYKTFP